MDPRLVEMGGRHSFEMGELFQQFWDRHPNEDFGLSDYYWPPALDAEWREFSKDLFEKHVAERRALADLIKAEMAQGEC